MEILDPKVYRSTRDQSHSKGCKNKGKSKSKKENDRYHYNQTHHSYADAQNYHDPQHPQEHTREAMGSKTRHQSSYQNWNQRNEGDYRHHSRPTPRWTNNSTDDWQTPTSSRPPQKGKGSHSDNPRTKGKVQQRPSEIEYCSFFPCEECMALAGTNQDCQNCCTHYSQHYQQLVRTFRSVQSFRQSLLPSFPCPIMHTDGSNCSACNSPSIYGTGNCDGCSLYRQFLWKTHCSTSTPVNPYNQTLYLGLREASLPRLRKALLRLWLHLHPPHKE